MSTPAIKSELPVKIRIPTEDGHVLVDRSQYLESGKDPNPTRAKRHDKIQSPPTPPIPRYLYSGEHIDPEPE